MYRKSWDRLFTFFSPQTSFHACRFWKINSNCHPTITLNGNDSYLIERGDKVKTRRAKQYGIQLRGSDTHTLGTEFMKITSDNGEIESTIFMAQFNEGYYLSLPDGLGLPKNQEPNAACLGGEMWCGNLSMDQPFCCCYYVWVSRSHALSMWCLFPLRADGELIAKVKYPSIDSLEKCYFFKENIVKGAKNLNFYI